MYVDKELLLSEGIDIGIDPATGPVYSANCIDLGKIGNDIGKGRPIYAVICIDEELYSDAGTGTCVFSVITNVGFTIESGSKVQVETRPMTELELTLGKVICLPIPSGTIGSAMQYLGMKFTIAGATTTKGKATVFLAFDPV